MTTTPVPLSSIARCLQGIIPCGIVTADAAGLPNVTFISQIHQVDEEHVALSRQFFSKTSRNLDATRRAAAEVLDPVTLEAYRLDLEFLRSETRGPLFDGMARRIQAIASHTGMAGVFRLIAADVCRVRRVERVDGFIDLAGAAVVDEPMQLSGGRGELRGLQLISETIGAARDLEQLVDSVLEALASYYGFEHMMLLLREEDDRLVTIASRGYGESGVGAEITIGEGLIGTVALEGRPIRIGGLEEILRYGRAVRRELAAAGGALAPEIPLPGLPDAQSALVIPLRVGDRPIGALAAESRNPLAFTEWHEAYLEVVANQVALGIDRMRAAAPEDDGAAALPARRGAAIPSRRRRFVFYAADESIFVDDEYLVRSVPAKILWRLLSDWKERGRVDFTNRELRVDPQLGLPDVKDNLESRLILLRRRLVEKCPDVRVVPTARGRFSLDVACGVELVQR